VVCGRDETHSEDEKKLEARKMPKMPQNPTNPLHALLGGFEQ
jgi:hypothetical protein